MTQPAHESGGLEKTLTKGKIAGVPVWAAGAGFAVLFILLMVYRNRQKTALTPTVDPNAANANGTGTFDPNAIDPATGLTYAQEGPAGYGLPSGPIGQYLGGDPTNPSYPVGLPAQGLPAPVTNQQWSRLAFDELAAKGDDPTLVSNALSKFLAGQPLSAAEQAVVNLAETIFGAPPEGLIPVTTTPPPTGGGTTTPPPPATGVIPVITPPAPTPTPTPPKTFRYVTVTPWPTKHSTLWGIAQDVYGAGTRDTDLYNANRKGTTRADGTPGMISNPNLIYTGWRILIP